LDFFEGLGKNPQVDNEGCFSGGHTHPYVLGKVVRLASAILNLKN